MRHVWCVCVSSFLQFCMVTVQRFTQSNNPVHVKRAGETVTCTHTYIHCLWHSKHTHARMQQHTLFTFMETLQFITLKKSSLGWKQNTKLATWPRFTADRYLISLYFASCWTFCYHNCTPHTGKGVLGREIELTVREVTELDWCLLCSRQSLFTANKQRVHFN